MKSLILLACTICALALGLSAHQASARVACAFEIDIPGQLPESRIVYTLECLVIELHTLRQENAALKQRLEEAEALLTELPGEFSNIDGVVTEDPERAIGTARFLLNARASGGPNALPIDERALFEVCGASGGCAVSVAFRQIGLFNDEPKDSVLSGPCQFTYAPDTREWNLGAGCGAGPISGTDGDRLSGNAEADPVIAASSGACIFSESEPSRTVGTEDGFRRDTAPGLFLVAMPSRQPAGIRRFECELVLN